MKTKEELCALKEEYKSLTQKLQELTDEELKIVVGGVEFNIPTGNNQYEFRIYK